MLKKVDLEFLERNSVTPRAYRNRAGRSEKTTDEKSLRARLKRRRIRTYRQLGHPSGLPYNVCDLHTVTQNDVFKNAYINVLRCYACVALKNAKLRPRRSSESRSLHRLSPARSVARISRKIKCAAHALRAVFTSH